MAVDRFFVCPDCDYIMFHPNVLVCPECDWHAPVTPQPHLKSESWFKKRKKKLSRLLTRRGNDGESYDLNAAIARITEEILDAGRHNLEQTQVSGQQLQAPPPGGDRPTGRNEGRGIWGTQVENEQLRERLQSEGPQAETAGLRTLVAQWEEVANRSGWGIINPTVSSGTGRNFTDTFQDEEEPDED